MEGGVRVENRFILCLFVRVDHGPSYLSGAPTPVPTPDPRPVRLLGVGPHHLSVVRFGSPGRVRQERERERESLRPDRHSDGRSPPTASSEIRTESPWYSVPGAPPPSSVPSFRLRSEIFSWGKGTEDLLREKPKFRLHLKGPSSLFLPSSLILTLSTLSTKKKKNEHKKEVIFW